MKFLIVAVILFSSMNAVYLQTTISPERNCISKIHLYAETGDGSKDESTSDFALNFMYSDVDSSCQSEAVRSFPRLYEVALYDRPGKFKDRKQAKGDVWTFEGPSDCSTVESIHRQLDTFMIDFASCDRDDWNVVDAMMYAELENSDLVLLGNKYGIDSPIDKNALFLSLSSVKRDNCEIKDLCITEIYIMAETSGDDRAGSDKGHSFKLNDKTFKLYNRKGNDMTKNKGDLWTYTASDIGISKEAECLKFGDVTYAGFTTKKTDGWKIKTAIVTVQLESGDYALLAGDVNLNQFLDSPSSSDVPLSMRNGGDCTDTAGVMEM